MNTNSGKTVLTAEERQAVGKTYDYPVFEEVPGDKGFDPKEPRDAGGRWTSGGGGKKPQKPRTSKLPNPRDGERAYIVAGQVQAHANYLSQVARRSGLAHDHILAAHAHDRAQIHSENIGEEDEAAEHEVRAEEHRNEAERIRKKKPVESGKKPDRAANDKHKKEVIDMLTFHHGLIRATPDYVSHPGTQELVDSGQLVKVNYEDSLTGRLEAGYAHPRVARQGFHGTGSDRIKIKPVASNSSINKIGEGMTSGARWGKPSKS